MPNTVTSYKHMPVLCIATMTPSLHIIFQDKKERSVILCALEVCRPGTDCNEVGSGKDMEEWEEHTEDDYTATE